MNTTHTKLLLGEPRPGSGGYSTVDLGEEADIKQDLNLPLEFPENSVDWIGTFHLIEHLRPSRARIAVASWVKALKPGGLLVIECPDFDQCVVWYLQTQSLLAKQWIFGNDSREGQHHFWGYNQEGLLDLFLGLNVDAEFKEPEDYHKNEGPCLRLEVTKRI